jgi:hypothetical protein
MAHDMRQILKRRLLWCRFRRSLSAHAIPEVGHILRYIAVRDVWPVDVSHLVAADIQLMSPPVKAVARAMAVGMHI